jgi:hypothetical protein
MLATTTLLTDASPKACHAREGGHPVTTDD